MKLKKAKKREKIGVYWCVTRRYWFFIVIYRYLKYRFYIRLYIMPILNNLF